MNLKEVLIKEDLYKNFENIKDFKLKNELYNKCSIKTYEKGDVLFFNSDIKNSALILNGKYSIRQFVSIHGDLVTKGTDKLWLGLSKVVSKSDHELEIVFSKTTNILFIPLNELLHLESQKNYDLWIKISKIAINQMILLKKRLAEKSFLPTKVDFLRYLKENNYLIQGLTIKEIAIEMNINIRTLQRNISSLKKEGLLIRDFNNKMIKAKSRSCIDDYLAEYI